MFRCSRSLGWEHGNSCGLTLSRGVLDCFGEMPSVAGSVNYTGGAQGVEGDDDIAFSATQAVAQFVGGQRLSNAGQFVLNRLLERVGCYRLGLGTVMVNGHKMRRGVLLKSEWDRVGRSGASVLQGQKQVFGSARQKQIRI